MAENLPPTNRPDLDLTKGPAARKRAKQAGRAEKTNSRPWRSKCVRAAAAYPLFLFVFWLMQRFAAESNWFFAFLSYMPQHYLFLPLIVLFYSAMRQKSRPALLINSGSVLIIVFVFLNFNIPLTDEADGAGNSRQSLRVMSYNCILSEENYKDIAAAIKKHDADVVCLQEAPLSGDKNLARKFLALFPNWFSSRDGQLITLSPNIITEAHVYHTQDENVAGVLKTVIDMDGSPVAVFNTHLHPPTSLNHARQDALYALPVRQRQLKVLFEETEKIDIPMVIAGDFNTPPRGPVYRALHERYIDTFRAVSWGFGQTFSVGAKFLRIDYIWTNDDVQIQDCKIGDDTVSDHYPLIANLWIPKKKNQ